MADKMHNIESIMSGINDDESKSWKIMGQKPQEQLNFWNNIHLIALERNINIELTAKFRNTIDRISSIYHASGLLS
jgi:hypothetical protein